MTCTHIWRHVPGRGRKGRIEYENQCAKCGTTRAWGTLFPRGTTRDEAIKAGLITPKKDVEDEEASV